MTGASRIAIVGNYVADQQQSMLRYGALVASMLATDRFDSTYLQPPCVFGLLGPRGGAVAKWLGYVDKFLLFPILLAVQARRFDAILICDHSNALYCRFTRRVPTLLICHDLLAVRAGAGEFPRYRPDFTGRMLQAMIRSSMRYADHVLCVSEATRRDVARLIGDMPASVIENPLHYDYAPIAGEALAVHLSRLGLAGRRYFLHVGGNDWYKNRLGVVGLFASLARHEEFRHHRLVFAGRPLSAELAAEVDRLGLREHVDLIEAPDNVALNALYCGAEALLFPSLHEGFGWPIVEAQAAGCSVVTSDRAPMCDVAGPEGAILVDPEDADRAAATYRLASRALDQYRKDGRRNVKRLDRATLANRYCTLIEALAHRRKA